MSLALRGAALTPAPLLGSAPAILVTLVVAVLALLPLDLAAVGNGFAPHPALAFVFVWTCREPARVGPVGVYVVGLAVDVLTLCPLGVCAAAYLVFQAIARAEAATLIRLPFAGRWFVYVLLSGFVVAAHTLAVMLMSGGTPDWIGVASSMIATVVAYPLAAALVPGPSRSGPRSSLRSQGR